jgi:hypothetical protein
MPGTDETTSWRRGKEHVPMSHRFPLNREANKMVAERIQYNATTPKGILRRTRDARFEKVEEPRHSNRIKHSLKGALELGVIGLATDTPSIRGIETRSDRLVTVG